ncbi:NADH2 dehydrogenase [Fomitopsis serialis]|uniref:NADH2 dehydrogenase n=1 Tax=Fomitopsis serialis TaxID=139415 RepID=UPI002008673E|nr:NADH2 dehydrogenase [Neoantrodia serialis]KAH9937655.1 NADH2 dehydrogenase [Neoantrodia serialis]
MFRLTRPLLNQLRKTTTGITGLEVHHDPIPHLIQTYQTTLERLSAIPETSVYRQGVEALTRHKLNIVQASGGNVAEVEKQLDEGHIEESLDVATDEMNLVSKVVEWKAWEPLVEKPEPGQWEYFGKTATASSS